MSPLSLTKELPEIFIQRLYRYDLYRYDLYIYDLLSKYSDSEPIGFQNYMGILVSGDQITTETFKIPLKL